MRRGESRCGQCDLCYTPSRPAKTREAGRHILHLLKIQARVFCERAARTCLCRTVQLALLIRGPECVRRVYGSTPQPRPRGNRCPLQRDSRHGRDRVPLRLLARYRPARLAEVRRPSNRETGRREEAQETQAAEATQTHTRREVLAAGTEVGRP